jgi:hypothetical protein
MRLPMPASSPKVAESACEWLILNWCSKNLAAPLGQTARGLTRSAIAV